MHEEDRATADALRCTLIFLGPSGSARSMIDDDGRHYLVVLTPDNPTFWWGNTLHADGPPRDGDVARWPAFFASQVTAGQPKSTHRTFSWGGSAVGDVAPFVAAGFTHFTMLVLAADRGATVVVPHANADARIAALAGDDWDALLALLIETREDIHTVDGYRPFATQRIAGWRRLVDAGQGAWFGAWRGDMLDAALGVFVEAATGDDGRRVGRFQHVTTRTTARRQGLAGMLVAHAARYGFDALHADRLLILADEHDVARRVYESAGFARIGAEQGLELPGG